MIYISGPSTIGKNPLISLLCNKYDYNYFVPWSSRKMRKDENGITDYHFVSKEQFQEMIRNEFIDEWDYVLSNYYGFSKIDPSSPKTISQGLSRMTIRIKKRNPQIKTIFLMPQNKDKIINILKNIYTGDDLTLRLGLVEEEILHSKLFDYVFTIQEKATELIDNKDFLELLNLNK